MSHLCLMPLAIGCKSDTFSDAQLQLLGYFVFGLTCFSNCTSIMVAFVRHSRLQELLLLFPGACVSVSQFIFYQMLLSTLLGS